MDRKFKTWLGILIALLVAALALVGVVYDKLTTSEDMVETVSAALNNEKAAVADLNTQIEDVKTQLAQAEEAGAALETQLAAEQTAKTELEGKLAAEQTAKTELEGKLAAEQTGGELCLTSSTHKDDHGTTLVATFNTQSIDFMPVGDIVSTICILIAGSPEIDFCFSDRSPRGEVTLDTRELKAILGEGISLAEPEIQQWIAEYLKEQYQSLVK